MASRLIEDSLFRDIHSFKKDLEKSVYGKILSSYAYSGDEEDYQITLSQKGNKFTLFLEKYAEKSERTDLVETLEFDSSEELHEAFEALKKDMRLKFASY